MLGLAEQDVTIKQYTGHWDQDGWVVDSTTEVIASVVIEPNPGTMVKDDGAAAEAREDWVMYSRAYLNVNVAQDGDRDGDEVVFIGPDAQEHRCEIIWRRDWRIPGPYRHSEFGLKEIRD